MRSVSFTFVYETDASRERGRTRAFNYFLRKAGMKPAQVGQRPGMDAGKAALMCAAKPVQMAGRVLNKTRRVLGTSRLAQK